MKIFIRFSIKQLGLLLFIAFLLSLLYLFEYWHTVNLVFQYYNETQRFNQIRETVEKLRVKESALGGLASVARLYKLSDLSADRQRNE